MEQEVTTYYLEMTSLSQFRPKRTHVEGFEVIRCQLPLPEYNRFFYVHVGEAWQWQDRLEWSRERWLAYLDRDELQTWVGYLHGTPVGYFELEMEEQNVQLAYFGLLPQFVGQGLGGLLLSKAIESAWQMGAKRVWVHTCSLDHPYALANYQARGFQIYNEVTEQHELPSLQN